MFLAGKSSIIIAKPRLVRQQAVQEEVNDVSSTSPKLNVHKFLPTIPSAADSSVIIDEESNNEQSTASSAANNNNVGSTFYTILQTPSGNTLTTLSSPKSNKLEKPP